MAREGNEYDVRGELLEVLLDKISRDVHPSITMLNLAESLLTPDDVALYTTLLIDKIKRERHPSISMMLRVRALTA